MRIAVDGDSTWRLGQLLRLVAFAGRLPRRVGDHRIAFTKLFAAAVGAGKIGEGVVGGNHAARRSAGSAWNAVLSSGVERGQFLAVATGVLHVVRATVGVDGGKGLGNGVDIAQRIAYILPRVKDREFP